MLAARLTLVAGGIATCALATTDAALGQTPTATSGTPATAATAPGTVPANQGAAVPVGTAPATSTPGSTPSAANAAGAAAAVAASPNNAPAAIVGDAARGKTKVATCLGCHAIPGYKADFPVVYSVPMIGGQNAKYIESALKAYQKGDRRFPSMIATARSLSDQDIADVAAYFSAQH